MFFVAISKESLGKNFTDDKVDEVRYGPHTATVVTDNFLSSAELSDQGLHVMESPFSGTPKAKEEVFVSIDFNKERHLLTISKAINSGRPVYYHVNDKGEFFCSSHISRLRKAGVPIKENESVLAEFLLYGFVMDPDTLYKDIRQVMNGQQLQIEFQGGKVSIKEKNFVFNEASDVPFEDVVQKASEILDESILNFAGHKDRVALLSSGGVDSSILAKICKDKLGITQTYSTGFPFEIPEFNFEKKYALSAAEALGVSHKYCEMSTEEYLSEVIDAIYHAESPVTHLQSVLLSNVFKKGIPDEKDIIISGEGADSAFLSQEILRIWNIEDPLNNALKDLESRYPFFKALRLLSCLTGPWRKTFYFKLIKSAARYTGKAKSVLLLIDIYERREISPSHFEYWMRDLDVRGDLKWVEAYFKTSVKEIMARRHNSLREFENRHLFDRITINAILGSAALGESIWSKIAEGHGKIIYYPLADKRQVDNALMASWEKKLEEPKKILLEVGRKLAVPEFILTRKKYGFGASFRSWSGRNGVLSPLVPVAAKGFDMKAISALDLSKVKHAFMFWDMLNYGIWKRVCINNESVENLKEELKCAMKKG